MNLALSTTLHTSFDEAVKLTRGALAGQGFGVLTEINVKETLKAKLGEDMEDYLILGACNPPLAHALSGSIVRSARCCRATSWCGPTPSGTEPSSSRR